MALTVKKLPVSPVRPVAQAVGRPLQATTVKVTHTEPAEREKPKSVTVRMPDNHMSMLEEIMERAECDKSEAIKRSIRREHSILSAKNATLTLTDADGKISTVPLVKNGVPL